MTEILKAGDRYSETISISQRDVYVFMGFSGTDNLCIGKVGVTHSEQVSINRRDVYIFMGLSGDDNNIHTDPDAALRGSIEKSSVPGFVPATHFSRLLGASFPERGIVYCSQSLYWRRPIYVDTPYIVELTPISVDRPTDEVGSPKILKSKFATVIRDENGEMVLGGEAVILADPDAAVRRSTGRVGVPGFVPAMHFSRVLGTIFPGHGTIYRNQNLNWRGPIYIDTPYLVEVNITSVEYPSDNFGNPKIPRAKVGTTIRDPSGDIVLSGDAVILHKHRLGSGPEDPTAP